MTYIACNSFHQAANVVNIFSAECYTTFRYVLPASLKWVWRKYFCNEIKTIPIQILSEKVKKVAYLSLHGALNQNCKGCPVLLGHGDYGHPYTMLHLADMAQKKGHPTFSLYIPGIENNDHFDLHNQLLQQAIDKIESMISAYGGKFAGLCGVGHSKAAILLAYRQFVTLDSRLKTTCAIAGRLNASNEEDCPDQELRIRLKNIYENVLKHPERPLVQIIPKDDWNAPYDSMAVRPHKYCYTVPGMHLSGLYSKETETHFTDLLERKFHCTAL